MKKETKKERKKGTKKKCGKNKKEILNWRKCENKLNYQKKIKRKRLKLNERSIKSGKTYKESEEEKRSLCTQPFQDFWKLNVKLDKKGEKR